MTDADYAVPRHKNALQRTVSWIVRSALSSLLLPPSNQCSRLVEHEGQIQTGARHPYSRFPPHTDAEPVRAMPAILLVRGHAPDIRAVR